MSLNFSTKADTLSALIPYLKAASIASVYTVTVDEWKSIQEKSLAFTDSQKTDSWIVRSSCSAEDTHQSSNAGAFLSLLNVPTSDLGAAIEKVIASYDQAKETDQVLIQPMLENVVCSGVAFSHDPNTCAPYRVVNWFDGADTEAITSGLSGHIWQQAADSETKSPVRIAPIIALLEELLSLFDHVPIDCEFAFTQERDSSSAKLWLLQARPLILSQLPEKVERQHQRLTLIEQKVHQAMQDHPFVMGKRTVFGVMPDWNPAEIIGVRPKPLAHSLYRELVTDSIWAYQRHNYGYRNLRSFPLMPNFFGLPYIDVRLSFNSFIPADLDDSIAGRLVDYYIDRLLAEPTLHDKIEFEIVFSCYTFDLPERLKALDEAGFSQIEQQTIADSLRTLTNKILHPKNGLWCSDANKLETLKQRREQLLSSNLDPIERIYWLLEDAKRYGTLPFAGLARAGFVAVQMLKSLVSVSILSEENYQSFMSNVSTVSGQLAYDRSTLDKTTFLARYGHLRPGTYDILSPRYDEEPDTYFDWTEKPIKPEKPSPFSLTLTQMRQIKALQEQHGLECDAVGLFDFLQAGIEFRELAKFYFTQNLSDALALMVEVGRKYDFTKEDLAYCDIATFQELYISATDPVTLLQKSIERGKEQYNESLKISLPPLITEAKDIWGFVWPETQPNFITQKAVVANVVSCSNREKLKGAIVCIENADPGFDWLFSYNIGGLVTAWGGVNSHMAIRAGELGLPAVVGAGEVLYRKYAKAHRLSIDCAAKKVEVLA